LSPITSVTFDNGKLSIEAGDDVIIVNKTKEGVINIERKT
jgi:hypothetical protein